MMNGLDGLRALSENEGIPLGFRRSMKVHLKKAQALLDQAREERDRLANLLGPEVEVEINGKPAKLHHAIWRSLELEDRVRVLEEALQEIRECFHCQQTATAALNQSKTDKPDTATELLREALPSVRFVIPGSSTDPHLATLAERIDTYLGDS